MYMILAGGRVEVPSILDTINQQGYKIVAVVEKLSTWTFIVEEQQQIMPAMDLMTRLGLNEVEVPEIEIKPEYKKRGKKNDL